ncbi:MAG: BTAD domain-containing putative transcriptional regulator [Burkholderiaceae bacterium]
MQQRAAPAAATACAAPPASSWCGAEQLALAESVAHDLAEGHGELLGGYDYPRQPRELQDWLDAQRRALQQRHRARDAERIAQCERDGQHAEGAALADALLAREPLHEGALRQLMKLRYLAGDGAAAIAAYDRFVAALAAEHPRARPARETAELLHTIRDAQSAPLPALRREIPASVLRPPRLVGRDAELAALRAAWSEQRAFWLLGEAGLGKSRLLAEFVAVAFGGTSPLALCCAFASPGGEPLRLGTAWRRVAPGSAALASPRESRRLGTARRRRRPRARGARFPAGEPPAWDGPAPATAALVVAARPGDGGVYAAWPRAARAARGASPRCCSRPSAANWRA